jgi:predicted small secreted protein
MRKTRLLIAACLLCAAAAALAGCSLTSVSGGQGSKDIDVTMGGHVTTDGTLDFKAVGYTGSGLQIENTATQAKLTIKAGTPISNGDGSVVARVVGTTALTLAPGQTGTLVLTGELAPGEEYYLGATDGGTPSIRQLFLCPGDAAGTGGSADSTGSALDQLP